SLLAALSPGVAHWSGADPLRDAFYALLQPNQVWTGDATALLSQLRAACPLAVLPKTSKGLSQALALIPGIRVRRAKTHQGRALRIARTGSASELAAAGHPISFS